jgi:hypothetical protein
VSRIRRHGYLRGLSTHFPSFYLLHTLKARERKWFQQEIRRRRRGGKRWSDGGARGGARRLPAAAGEFSGECRRVPRPSGCASPSLTWGWWPFSLKRSSGGAMGLRPVSGKNSGEPEIGFLFDACIDRDDPHTFPKFRSKLNSGEFPAISGERFHGN